MTRWLVVLNLALVVGNLVILIKLLRKNREATATLEEAGRCLREATRRLEEAGDNQEQARAALRSARLRARATS